MSLFCILAFDEKNSNQKRQENLENHLKHLRKLKDVKKLLFAGPLLDSDQTEAITCGSMLIVDFNNLQDAKKWFEQDPYFLSGIFREIYINAYIECIEKI